MGTISVNLPSDGSTADVADLNNPINTIVTAINGGLDNDNIKASAGIDPAKLAFSKTTDANGWTIYDYGRWKEYSKQITFSQSVTAGAIATLTVSSGNLPVGVTNIGTNELKYSTNISSGFGADAHVSTEIPNLATSTAVNFSISNLGASTRTYTGTIDIALKTR